MQAGITNWTYSIVLCLLDLSQHVRWVRRLNQGYDVDTQTIK